MKFNQPPQLNDPFERPTPKQNGALPLPPINVFVISPYINGALDIRWDNPALLPENTKFQIVGVNIYRSLDSEGGPYTKINDKPLGAGVYRDITKNVPVLDEVVTNLSRGTNQQKEWKFQTTFYPLVKNNLTNQPIASFEDVVVKSDNGDGNGLLEIPLYKVHAETGEIVLIKDPIFDPATQKLVEPRLPLNAPGSLTVSYFFNSNLITMRLNNRIFYKLTTVGINNEGTTVESDLDYVTAVNMYQQEKTDYIWREAIRRNRWILEQGGERVKVLIRKWNGQLCPNYDETHITSENDCPTCYGTNYIGGYEGPFDVIIAPPDQNKDVVLTDIGLTVRFTFETWTGPSPMLNKRDIIVRPSGERFTVGAINYVGQRGAIFQQMFQVSQLDSGDFLYTLPIDGAQTSPASPDDTRSDVNLSPASPVIPSNKPIDRNYPLDKGRTVTFENIMY